MRRAVHLLMFALSAATACAVDGDTDAPEGTTIVSRIRRQPTESSALAKIGYSKRLHALEIEFRNGAIYRYVGVPAETYRQLMASDSKAHFYDLNIRGCYQSVHVRPHESE